MMRTHSGDAEETALAAQAPIQHNRFHKMDPPELPSAILFPICSAHISVAAGFPLEQREYLEICRKESNSREIILRCVQILPIRLLPWRSLAGSTAQATLWESSG